MIESRMIPFFREYGDLKVKDITGDEINDYYVNIRNAGLKGTTAQRHHALLHLAFKTAVKRRAIPSNPVEQADRPKAQQYIGKYYNATELKELLDKEDVIAYLEDRKIFPEAYAAPKGWYKGYYEIKLEIHLPPEVLEDMHAYYADLFSQYKDVLTAIEVCKLTGYSKTAINNWCAGGQLKAFKRSNVNHIPKIYLIEFFCSAYCRSVTRKSDWHIRTLKRFPSWRSQKQSQGGAK